MKYLALLAFLFLPSKAHAQFGGVMNTHQVYLSTNSVIQSITLCQTSKTGVDVAATTSSGTLVGRTAMSLSIPAVATTTVVCSFDYQVSTAQWSVWYGLDISTGAPTYIYAPDYDKVWCMTKNGGGCGMLTVGQYK